MSKDCRPLKDYVECIETLPDGTKVETRIPYAKNDPGPSLPRRAKNFAVATVKHKAKGSPTASDADVDARFAICQACESFEFRSNRQLTDGTVIELGKCLDLGCGCVLANSHYQGTNKLRWADQQCPIGKWGEVDGQDTV